MTVLLASRLPQGTSVTELLEDLNRIFPASGNSCFFESKISEKNEEGALESLYSLLVLSMAIGMLPSRCKKSCLFFEREACGKPYFKGSPVFFNLSHSQGYVACCVSDDCEVGVDIEASCIAPEKAVKLSKRYFSEKESAEIELYPDRFARIWSENEAEAKLFGKDLAVFFKEKKINEKSQTRAESTYFHRFSAYNIPITVCTSSHLSTILFKIIQ